MKHQQLPLQSRNVRIVPPYPITHQFKVQDEFVGKSLLDMMCIRFPFHAKEEWLRRIQNGRVGINGQSVATSYQLLKSDLVYHHNPKVVEPSVPDEVKILKETNDWLAVYKPAPLSMHPGGRFNKNTLTAILEDMGYEKLRIIHRLDAVTSGIVLFAKNKEFARRGMEAFTASKVQKIYYAKVHGVPVEKSRTINSSIRRKNGFVFESGDNLLNAKKAETHFEVAIKGSEHCVIKCFPKTGRTHQIRLHLEEWGYPIIDDPIYGPNGDTTSKRTQNRSISLVSAGLSIPHLNIELAVENPFSC